VDVQFAEVTTARWPLAWRRRDDAQFQVPGRYRHHAFIAAYCSTAPTRRKRAGPENPILWLCSLL